MEPQPWRELRARTPQKRQQHNGSQREAHFHESERAKIGRRNAEQVEVLSGLAPGDQVITSDYTGFERIDRIDLKQ